MGQMQRRKRIAKEQTSRGGPVRVYVDDVDLATTAKAMKRSGKALMRGVLALQVTIEQTPETVENLMQFSEWGEG